MVKKYFPHLFISLFLVFFIFIGAFTKNKDVRATNASEIVNKSKYYEGLLKTLKVTTTKSSLIEGSKIKQPIIIINFWASWCRPCISEFSSLNKLIAKIGKDKIFVLGINNDSEDGKKTILKTEKKYSLAFESIREDKYNLTDKFSVTSIPASFVYKNGKLHKIIDKEFDFMGKDFVDSLEK
jgi:thiol-disulfide isomerase/thioredoxin